ncbi:MAG TPA: DUF2975 domain-containing protein, partial [Sporichthya sp.]|nr:DUF2975 domain-containing protein [Sporichthya sp.]
PRCMLTERRAMLGLRIFLVVMFGVLVVMETLSLPGQFRYMAEEHPENAELRWPLTAASVFLVICVQVVIVAIWKLLRRVERDRIFSPESFAWVDAIVWAVAAAWTVLVGLCVLVAFQADDPGGPLALFLLTVGVTVVGLLMVVMRALLRQATALRTDLEAVI